MGIGNLFHEAIAQLIDCSEAVAEWRAAVEEISARANAWLGFSTACAWAGFALSAIAAALLVYNMRGEINWTRKKKTK